MKLVQLLITINDDNTLKSAVVQLNTTDFPTDKKLLQMIAQAIITDKELNEVIENVNNILNNEPDGGG